ncbi:MAG: nitrile hydratase subunit beta [Alphaproteobacteria bacterium]|nr:nitrile hydratase subunit beta [Alphaproteobacteria bacterium]
MNGGHDLGGMHGLGPIDAEPEASEPVFHADWERRVFAMTLACASHGRWTIDGSRHARERQNPADYIRHSYFENWLAGLEKLLVESELVTAEELAQGQPAGPVDAAQAERVLKADKVEPAMTKGGPTLMDVPLEPRFRPGDRVHVRNINPTGHTRSPRYARGKFGTVEVDHGVHVFADKSAHGTREGQHLYGVRFAAQELWGTDASAHDSVRIDLWDDHLEPA